MGWAIGFDERWQRDIGYGVPALCDAPNCNKQIDRGLSYVCGSEPYGGEHGCGLYFCGDHMWRRNPRNTDELVDNCKRCMTYKRPYKAKPDIAEWTEFKMIDPSWQSWRDSKKVIRAAADGNSEQAVTPEKEK
jgi:hypothetical protein